MTCQLMAQEHSGCRRMARRVEGTPVGRLLLLAPGFSLAALQDNIWHMHKGNMMADHSKGIYLHE